MRADRFDLPLRIVVQNPVPGLLMALQRGATGKADLVGGAMDGHDLAFDLDVAIEGALADGRPRFLGPWVQGPPDGRFVYIVVADAGRVKVPLGGIGWDLIEGLPPGGRLEGRIPGRGRNNGPALASVQILPPGWTAASR